MTNRVVRVIGHRNPDLDSVAAASAYAELKSKISPEISYLAGMAGTPNRETAFALERFELPLPEVVTDMRARVGDLIDYEPLLTVKAGTTMSELVQLVRQKRAKTLPVVDNKQVLLGLITIGDLAALYMDSLGSDHLNLEASPMILANLMQKKAREIMVSNNLAIFDDHELVNDARHQMVSTRYRNYPVVDDDGRFIGFIGRRHLLDMKRKQVILVDHNETKQAVDGVEECEILEIIDHHRVGDIQTIAPIFFRNEPVGATSTLITESYFVSGQQPNKSYAGTLLSGILSDTMLFKSPTTTERDHRAAALLAAITGVDIDDWGRQLFIQAAGFEERTPYDIIKRDLKEYVAGQTVLAVAQVETVDLEALKPRKRELLSEMEELCSRRQYGAMFLMVTDIFKEGTELLVAGPKKSLAEKAFGKDFDHDGSLFLKGVMSRKKQVIPLLYRAAAEEGLL
ncbi:MAG: putative manganese-dependent inorganic diphosphatase [Methanomassiliicoccales archaeon]